MKGSGVVADTSHALGSYGQELAQGYIILSDTANNGLDIRVADLPQYNPSDTNQKFKLDGVYTISTETIYKVELNAIVWNGVSGNLGGGTGTLTAYVDPQITVVGPNADLYSLYFSSGVGNTVGDVPELSTWAMMLLGFAGLGFTAYRRASSNETASTAA